MRAGGVRAELLKQGTLPAVRWTGTLTPVAAAMLAAAVASSGRAAIDPEHALAACLPYVQAGVVVIGALVAGQEYAGRQAQLTLLACPRRLRLVWTKLLVALITVTAVSVVTVAAGYLGVGVVTRSDGMRPDAGHVATAVAQLVTIGMLAHGVAMAVRSTSATLVLVLGEALIASPLLAATSLGRWLPGRAIEGLAKHAGRCTGVPPPIAVLAGWLLLVNVLGAWRLWRADS